VQARIESNRKWWTLGAVTLAVFVTTLDNTVVNVALPSIQTDLGLGRSALEWVVSSYVLAFGFLLLTGGKLADVFGRQRLFLLGLVVFTGASLLGGFAGNAELLIIGRALQGLGAALMTPASLAIISATFEERERGKAIGIWAGAMALAFALGPVTGGALAEHVHWSWIFFLNIPVGLAAIVVGRAAIAESRDTTVGRSLDVRGLVTSAVGLLALIYALIEANTRGWDSPLILSLIGVAAVALAAFAVVELRGREPMLPLSLFRTKAVAGANAIVFLNGVALFGVYLFTSLFLQGVLGLTAVEAGVAFVPMAVLSAVASGVSDKLAARSGPARVVSAGLLLIAVGLVLLALVDETGGIGSVMPGLIACGIGWGLTTPIFSVVLGAVAVEKSGVASGLLNTSREVGGAFGIAVMGAILAARESSALAGGSSGPEAFLSGYSTSLIVASGLILAGAVIAWRTLGRPRPPATELAPQPA
jgi:EmrB/QacA subfamily drug resistance transporter